VHVADSVDLLLESWHAKRADLDFTPVGVVARLARVRGHIDRELEPVFAAHGLGGPSFSVLVTLARIGDEGGVSQRRLMDELGLTSGTISVRMDRLVEQGLVERRPDPASRRNSLITLTARGRELFERVVPAHLANERRLLSALDDDERELLAALLRKLLVEFEGSRPDAGPAPLGLTVVPAFVGMAMRESVGLPAVAALLVRAVDQGGAACAAGVRTGDVLLRAGGRELRSVESLYAALADASDRLELRVLRGTEETDLIVPVPAGLGRATTCGRGAAAEHAL
jgi:DNA-binding MarR family transcriptional regulator